MPWDLTTWVAVGVAAFLCSAGSFLLREDRNGNPRVAMLLIASVASVYLWFIWGINAFSVEIVTDAGIVFIREYRPLGWFGYLAGMLMVLDLFAVVIEAAGYELPLFGSEQMDRDGRRV